MAHGEKGRQHRLGKAKAKPKQAPILPGLYSKANCELTENPSTPKSLPKNGKRVTVTLSKERYCLRVGGFGQRKSWGSVAIVEWNSEKTRSHVGDALRFASKGCAKTQAKTCCKRSGHNRKTRTSSTFTIGYWSANSSLLCTGPRIRVHWSTSSLSANGPQKHESLLMTVRDLRYATCGTLEAFGVSAWPITGCRQAREEGIGCSPNFETVPSEAIHTKMRFHPVNSGTRARQ